MTTPNTAEQYAAQIPALQTLISLGWNFMPAAECFALRGGNGAVILKSSLVEALRKRRLE